MGARSKQCFFFVEKLAKYSYFKMLLTTNDCNVAKYVIAKFVSSVDNVKPLIFEITVFG